MTSPGPNDLEPCTPGSEGCRRWHLARGRDHVCGRDEPAPERVNRLAGDLVARLETGDWRSRRWPAVLADDVDGGVA